MISTCICCPASEQASRRAGELGDKQNRGVRVILSVLRVGEAEHAPGILDHDVLEPAARADKGPAFLPSEADCVQRADETLIRAARGTPERIEPLHCLGGLLLKGRSRQPLHLHSDACGSSGVRERLVGGGVRAEARVEVADDADAGGLSHMNLHE